MIRIFGKIFSFSNASAQFIAEDNIVSPGVPKSDSNHEAKDTTAITPELRNRIETFLSQHNKETMEILFGFENQLEELKKIVENNFRLIKKEGEYNINMILQKDEQFDTELKILKENVLPLNEQVNSINLKMETFSMLEKGMHCNETMLQSLNLDVGKLKMEVSELKQELCRERDSISDLEQSTERQLLKTDSSYAQCEKKLRVVNSLLSSRLVKLEQSTECFQSVLEKRQENLAQFTTMKENLCKLQWKTISLNIQIDVILAGEDGMGKTSTGNSILGSSKFGASRNKARIQISEEFRTAIDDVTLKVTDPLPDNQVETLLGLQIKSNYDPLFKVLKPAKFHAFIYVVKFGLEKYDFLFDLIKQNYGIKILKNHCVIVMCGGDEFYKENPSATFESWCEKQTGRFANMYTDCNKRIVLFDNATSKNETILEQRSKLLKAILNLPSKGNTFNIKGALSECSLQ
ncbi:uncharacterized protein LOC131934595 [Physella acuta]|uniref:uncharacterized protein LOC131934595 n=1 Tax=Physella acuta TaxID=109671 RepID=UPI0027DE8B50|nr:uncharacterized protein LOC131934595 [Physella acuta]